METKRMNVLVTGGNGQLGCALRKVSPGSRHRFIFADVKDIPGAETVLLDAANPAAVELICESEQVDAIVNCAAYTDVDGAESDPATAALLNRDIPACLAAAARRRKAILIHISTDYIFSGDANRPIPETAVPAPGSVYGATKLAGEKAITDSACRYLIIRSAWLFSEFGRNFVKTMRRLTAERDSLRVVCDQVGSPTSADDLAEFILTALDSGKTGIFNYTDLGAVSWYDFALAIRDLSGGSCEITPCLSSEYPHKAERPAYSVLDKTLVQKTFGITIPHWHESLRKCMEALERHEDNNRL